MIKNKYNVIMNVNKNSFNIKGYIQIVSRLKLDLPKQK